MRVPLRWLSQYVDPGLDVDRLADRLSETGTLVEEIHRSGLSAADGNTEFFRVGRVLQADPHPNADRLRVCLVDVGEADPSQIVCGAPNVAVGQAVAVVLPGGRLPGVSAPLKRAKLRGVESRGMIMSAAELQLETASPGIMVLEGNPTPGTPLTEVLDLAEQVVLELEITSNRPDCLGIHGIAREVHAATGAELAPLDVSEPAATGEGRLDELLTVRVEDADLCPRYMARVFTDVEVGPSPAWLVECLEGAGMRSISNVVDITNYVMLLTGQPLHAFDLDRLAGAQIVVRRASDGESITTLDGQQRQLDSATLAICDAERPAVIAGIFGAEFAEVGPTTRRVALEAATFAGPAILTSALTLGLRTESSARFEKGLSPELPPSALAVASRLLAELAHGRMVPGTIDVAAPWSPPEPVRLRPERVERLLGVAVPVDRQVAILERLGCTVSREGDVLVVDVPCDRARDLTREVDLIEEVGRIHGLDAVPTELPRLVGRGALSPDQASVRRLSRRLADLGLSEVVTHHQVPESDADALHLAPDDPRRQVVRMAHPMSAEMAVMRRSMLPGLLRAVARNQSHQRADGGLFEVGRTYAPREDGLADERRFVAAVGFGRRDTEGWRAHPRPVDVHWARGAAEALLATARVPAVIEPNAAPYFHPVRQAKLVARGLPVAWVGEVHPLVLREFGVDGPVAAIVLDLDQLLIARPTDPPQFRELLTVPVSTRDLALVVDHAVRAADLVDAAQRAGGGVVREARIFDRYVGEQVGEGRVSLALRLSLADPERTLTDADIDATMAAVREGLEKLGARLRT